jgi:hypothetical protein
LTRAAKRAKESEAKEWKLKYDVLKGKYDNEIYGGRKTPKKLKEEKDSMKDELTKMSKKIEKLNQENIKLEEQILSGGAESSQNIEKIEKRSKSRLVKLRRQKKIIIQVGQLNISSLVNLLLYLILFSEICACN